MYVCMQIYMYVCIYNRSCTYSSKLLDDVCTYVSCVDVQRVLDEEVRLLRTGFTDKYLKDLKDKERQMELLLRKADELAAYPPPAR